jgi:hypothetical protein
MLDKPLHVQVAEALGEKCEQLQGIEGWWIVHSVSKVTGNPRHLPAPDYDIDWSATGPLIERLKINLLKGWASDNQAWHACTTDGDCLEFNRHAKGRKDEGYNEPEGNGPTPLLAVCDLILELHKQGKLTTTV